MYKDGASADLYHDFIQLTVFNRNRDIWKEASEMRINEFRKTRVKFQPNNIDFDHVEIIQTKSSFPFGATMNKNVFDNENTRNLWAELFNYGVAENQQKWKQNEKKEGILDFTYADKYADFWDSLGIPFRGHCLYWGNTGSSVHVPDWFDQNPTYTAMQNRNSDAARRYEGNFLHTLIPTFLPNKGNDVYIFFYLYIQIKIQIFF